MSDYSLSFSYGTCPAHLEVLFLAPGIEVVLHIFCEGVGLDIALSSRENAAMEKKPDPLLVVVTDFDQYNSPNFDCAWHGTSMKTKRDSSLATLVHETMLCAYQFPTDREQQLVISRIQSNATIDERGLAIIGASCALHLLNPEHCPSPLSAISISTTEQTVKTNCFTQEFHRGGCDLIAVTDTHGLVYAELSGLEVKEHECIQYLNIAYDHARNLLNLINEFCEYVFSEKQNESVSLTPATNNLLQARQVRSPLIERLSINLGVNALEWLVDLPPSKRLVPVHFGISARNRRTTYINLSLTEVDRDIDSEFMILGSNAGVDWFAFRSINQPLSTLAFKDAVLYGRLLRCNHAQHANEDKLNMLETSKTTADEGN